VKEPTWTCSRAPPTDCSCVDAEGKPVVRGNVQVGTRDGKKIVGWTDIDNGKATIEALPPGTWWVTSNVSTAPSDIEIQSGKPTHLDLRYMEFRVGR
jgi:hypothetical protein